MPQLYPSSLQDNFNRGTFRRTPGNNSIYTKMDTGPQKVRRRTTLRVDSISGNILLKDNTEYNDFINWYTSTLQDGTLSFYFDDPVTGNQLEVQFLENGMDISDVGFQTYAVKMSLEVKNE